MTSYPRTSAEEQRHELSRTIWLCEDGCIYMLRHDDFAEECASARVYRYCGTLKYMGEREWKRGYVGCFLGFRL